MIRLCVLGFLFSLCLPLPISAQIFQLDTTSPVYMDTDRSAGAAWGDYDGDMDLDLVVVHLGRAANAFYRNDGHGTLTRISDGVISSGRPNGLGACWMDYDNSGTLDLYVTTLGASVGSFLYNNQGDGSFLPSDSYPTAGSDRDCTWADIDEDGDLDLFLAVRFDAPNALFRNNGDGTFTRDTGDVATLTRFDAVAAIFADYDDDGDSDLFVTNRNAPNELYRNEEGSFTAVDVPGLTTDNLDAQGATWGDYDNDGDLDLYVANFNAVNSLFRNDGGGAFTPITDAGPLVTDVNGSFVASWGDYDNDGHLDMLVGTHVSERDRLYRNLGDGTFEVVTTEPIGGVSALTSSVAWADYDLDGDLDVVLTQQNAQDLLFVNTGTPNNWLNVSLEGQVSNASAVGARVTLTATTADGPLTQTQEVRVRTGRTSQGSPHLEFGLGTATVVDHVEIRWPSGTVQTLTDVPVNTPLRATEPVPTCPANLRIQAYQADPDGIGDGFVRIQNTSAAKVALGGCTFGVLNPLTARFSYVTAFPARAVLDAGATFTLGMDETDAQLLLPVGSLAFDLSRPTRGTIRWASYFGVFARPYAVGDGVPNANNPEDGVIASAGVYELGSGPLVENFFPAEASAKRSTDPLMQMQTLMDGHEADALPNVATLHKNYPNPFNPTTQITFSLPEEAPVRLTVYDATGQTVRVLADGSMSAGQHAITFDASNLASGLYMYRLVTPSQALTQQMILMK